MNSLYRWSNCNRLANLLECFYLMRNLLLQKMMVEVFSLMRILVLLAHKYLMLELMLLLLLPLVLKVNMLSFNSLLLEKLLLRLLEQEFFLVKLLQLNFPLKELLLSLVDWFFLNGNMLFYNRNRWLLYDCTCIYLDLLFEAAEVLMMLLLMELEVMHGLVLNLHLSLFQ
jgi:hypothetical protein